MSKKRRKRKDGLRSKVIDFKPLRDQKGSYIPYCNLSIHLGLVCRENVCKTRTCPNYIKLYIKDGKRPYFAKSNRYAKQL